MLGQIGVESLADDQELINMREMIHDQVVYDADQIPYLTSMHGFSRH